MNIVKGYTFDDVLLVPKKSYVNSRDDIDLSVDLGKGIKLHIPIVSANMKNVTGPAMAHKISELGGLALLHRFVNSVDEYINQYKQAILGNAFSSRVGVSIGVHDREKNLIEQVAKLGCRIVCVDVAHGDHINCIKMCEYIHSNYPNILLIGGNVATAAGAINLASVGADVVKVGVGSGCFASGTRILLSNGTYKNIEDIKTGDRVINMNGNPVNVIKSFCTGIKKVSKIRNSISYKPTFVTPDHNYFIGDLTTCTQESKGYKVLEKLTKSGQSKYKWCEISNKNKFTLLIPSTINFELSSEFEINLYKRAGGNGHSNIKNKLDFCLTPNYELGYIFGTFLGDGCSLSTKAITNIGNVSWYFGLNEDDIAEKLNTCINKIFSKKLSIKKNNNIIICRLYYKPLADFLKNFGKKSNKYLPEKYIVNNKEYLQGLHDGLVDSDGNIEKVKNPKHNGRIVFDNTSIKLIELFNVITYLLTGVFPNSESRKITSGKLKNVNYCNLKQPYISRINSTAQKRVGKNYQISKLLEYTEQTIEVPVYDLTVDCDTHSFIADNAIVHNSICSTRIETGNGVPQLSAIDNVYNGLLEKGFHNCKIISDGGARMTGDLTKALCFSHAVMLGNMLAGSEECPGDIILIDGKEHKQYAGSSTHKSKHVEGVIAIVPYKGPVDKIIVKLTEGLRSGLSYQGANNLEELRKDPQFVLISNAGLIESKPHDVRY